MSQITEEVLGKEIKRLEQDERTARLADSINELEQMGFAKKSSYEPSPADTIGRQFYELNSSMQRRYSK